MAACNAMGCTFRNNRKSRQQLEFEQLMGEEVRLYRFPKNPEMRALWLAAMNRTDFKVTEGSRICSRHFTVDCFERFATTIRLLPEAIPTVFTHLPRLKKTNKNRRQLMALIPKDRRKKLWKLIAETGTFDDCDFEINTYDEQQQNPVVVQTEDPAAQISLQDLVATKVGENAPETSLVEISEINLREPVLATDRSPVRVEKIDAGNETEPTSIQTVNSESSSPQKRTIIIFKEREMAPSSEIPLAQPRRSRAKATLEMREMCKRIRNDARKKRRYYQQLLRRLRMKMKKVSVLVSDLADAGLMHEEAQQMLLSALGTTVVVPNVSSDED